MDDDKAAPADSVPPYRYIADVLRGEILDGCYQVGERIPAQAELEERFRVSRPTIQRALGELRKDGYIDNHRGRSAEVLPWQDRGTGSESAGGGGPQPAFAALAVHVAEAFAAPRVTIDSYSLTTETLNTVLSNVIQKIHNREVPAPESVRMRFLLPSADARLAYPRLAADLDDERPLRRLRGLIKGHSIAIRSSFTSVERRVPEMDLKIDFRSVPITPLHKLYLFNQDVALFGTYRLVKRPISFDGEHDEDMFDVLGIDATLFPFRRAAPDATDPSSRFVSESQEWFDALWTTIAQPMDLFE